MKREEAPVKVDPTFLTEYIAEDNSTESMAEYRVLSRLRLIQALSPSDIKELGPEGTVILTPGNQVVMRPGESVEFVPIYQYTEFVKWADRRDKNAENPVAERTMDRTSPLAQRARDFDNRFEQYEGGPKGKPYQYQYVEHINFVGMIYGDHELAMTPIAISFAKGEAKTGMNFCSSILMRKVGGKQAPLWATVWRFVANERHKDDWRWWGLDFSNPGQPYITEDEAPDFLALHKEFKELFEKNLAGVDYGEPDNADVVDADDDDDDEM